MSPFGAPQAELGPSIVALDGSYDTFDRLAPSRSLGLALSHSIEFRLGGETLTLTTLLISLFGQTAGECVQGVYADNN